MKNDQNQSKKLKIKTAAIFDLIISFEIFSENSKSQNSHLCFVTKIMTSSASFQ